MSNLVKITVLEELDEFKKGNDSINFQAREFIRKLDDIVTVDTLSKWIPLGENKGKIKVVMDFSATMEIDAISVFSSDKMDHRIINTALSLQKEFPKRKVILVSKDINLRLKAKSLQLQAEDYTTDKIRNISNLNTGKNIVTDIDPEAINTLYTENSVPKTAIFDPKIQLVPNSFFILKSERNSVLGYYSKESEEIQKVEKKGVYGIKPRNSEQAFAIHALLDPNVKLVTIQGMAGTGKTLIALAAALEQRKNFHQIFLARPIVPLSNKEIGYLPGDIASKVGPYMEPLWDNLKFIQKQYDETSKEFKAITEMVKLEKLMVQPLAYIRGRSLSNIFFIIDEAQNLTSHEIKTIITRAGDNTKMIFTGDIHQIDTPYLDTQSNGLSYMIDKLKGSPLYAHITLEKGERSELANLANTLL